jgi:RHS repeat-associated protein
MTSTLVSGGSTGWTYNAAGQVSTRTAPNGERASWQYQNDGTLRSKELDNSSNTVLAQWGYAVDSDYRLIQQSFVGLGAGGANPVQGNFLYGYDNASRINVFTPPSGVDQAVTWDHNGNRLTYAGATAASNLTFAYNADNSIKTEQLGAGAASTYSYGAALGGSGTDHFGGVTHDVCTTYTYDAFDRLASQNTAGGGACGFGTSSSTYLYDPLDRQRSRTDSAGTTTTHYDGLSSAATVETLSAVDTAYELDPGGNRLGVKQNGGNNNFQYLDDDGTGNITATTDASQALKCTTRFDPFGTPLGAPTSGFKTPCNTGTNQDASTGHAVDDFFFKGGRQDLATGQYQFGARVYDPHKSAFLTPDNFRQGNPGGSPSVGADPMLQNTYSYVNGDPVNLADPSGHNPCTQDDCNALSRASYAQADRGGGAFTAAQTRRYSAGHMRRTNWVAGAGFLGRLLGFAIASPAPRSCDFWCSAGNGATWALKQEWEFNRALLDAGPKAVGGLIGTGQVLGECLNDIGACKSDVSRGAGYIANHKAEAAGTALSSFVDIKAIKDGRYGYAAGELAVNIAIARGTGALSAARTGVSATDIPANVGNGM